MEVKNAFKEFYDNIDDPSILTPSNDTFAFNTIKNRIPAIIRDAITSSRNFLPEDKYRHISEGLSNLIKLIDKDMLPKVEALIRSKDQYIWDSFNTYYNEHPTINILTIPWLVSECSLYRKIQQICQDTYYDTDEHCVPDLFKISDKSNLDVRPGTYVDSLISYVEETVQRYDRNLTSTPPVKDDVIEIIASMLQFSMWGNSVDLSLQRNLKDISRVTDNLPPSIESIKVLSKKILLNHVIEASTYIYENLDNRIDIILDNSVTELFSDLCLAHILCSLNISSTVFLHPKSFQWFVSDATIADIYFVIKKLSESNVGKHVKFSERLVSYLNSGKIVIHHSYIWTTPICFSSEFFLNHDIWTSCLSKSSLLIFKGDLNYRKLISDKLHPEDASLEATMGKLGTAHARPALLSLRVCKSTSTVGVPPCVRRRLELEDPDWSTGGKYATITFLPPK